MLISGKNPMKSGVSFLNVGEITDIQQAFLFCIIKIQKRIVAKAIHQELERNIFW
jgi:hypothetical protein